MLLAIEEAKKSTQPLKCGTVIVKDGKVIAKAYNSQRESKDACAHAEIKAIGIAGQTIGNKNLNGCDVYSTCEPCLMCLAAISFAEVERLFFGISLKDASSENIDISTDYFISKSRHKFQVIKNFLKENCQKLI